MDTITPRFKLAHSRISEDEYNNEDVLIVVSSNSVSCKNFGLTRDVVQKYPYADVAGIRRPPHTWHNTAVLEDRSPEGSVYINQPPIYRSGPTVATLITQYGVGKSVEENPYAKQIIERSGDFLYTSRLENDTLQNRIIYFDKCLLKLASYLKKDEFNHIKRVVIPAGIGRQGKMDNIWLTKYLPILGNFAGDIHQFGKVCIVLTSDEYLKFTESRVKNSQNDNLINCVKQLSDLRIAKWNTV